MTDADVTNLLADLMIGQRSIRREHQTVEIDRWLCENQSALCRHLREQPLLLEQLRVAGASHRGQEDRRQPKATRHNRRRGALVVIEGIDGSGKGTQAELLHANSTHIGLTARRLSFPRYSETVFAQLIAEYLNGGFGTIDTVPARCSALLFAGDRFESRTLLERMITDSDIVILDRYVASNVAYHSARVSQEDRSAFNSWLYTLEYDLFGMPLPNQHILLDVPADLASSWVLLKAPRSYTAAAADIHEQRADYMQRCREMFLELSQDATFGPWARIECVDSLSNPLPVATVAELIWTVALASVSPHAHAEQVVRSN